MNLTLEQWNAMQERAVNPFRSNESNAVNRLTRILTLGKDVVIKENNSTPSVVVIDTSNLNIKQSHYIKDDVYIHMKSDYIIDFRDANSFEVVTDGTMDMAGTYKVVLNYTYSESIPVPVATYKILKPTHPISTAHVLVCNAIVTWNAGLNRFEVTSINFDGVPYLYLNTLYNGVGGSYHQNVLSESTLPGNGHFLSMNLGQDLDDYKVLLSIKKAVGNVTPDVGEYWYTKVTDSLFRVYNSGVNNIDKIIWEVVSKSNVTINASDVTVTKFVDGNPVVITFNVTASGLPKNDAVVTFAGMTNPVGVYTFSVFPGTHTYTVSATGFATRTGTVNVTNAQDVPVNLDVFTEPVVFNVLVGGAPYAGATITYGGVTNPVGNYAFNVVPGTYNYTITSPGYNTETGTLNSTTGTQTVTMTTPSSNINAKTIDQAINGVLSATAGQRNVFVLPYKSDSYGAQANFGMLTIRGYNPTTDIILWVDENNSWASLTQVVGTKTVNDVFISLSISKTPTTTDSTLNLRSYESNLASTNALTIEGAAKTKIGNRLTTIPSVTWSFARSSDITNLNDYIQTLY